MTDLVFSEVLRRHHVGLAIEWQVTAVPRDYDGGERGEGRLGGRFAQYDLLACPPDFP